MTNLLTIDALIALDFNSFVDAVRHLILPAVALGTIPLAIVMRITRASVVEVLSEDYVRTARAKGLGEREVVLTHVLRNSMIPVVTVVALGVPAIFGGAIITEQVFKVNGIGQLLKPRLVGAPSIAEHRGWIRDEEEVPGGLRLRQRDGRHRRGDDRPRRQRPARDAARQRAGERLRIATARQEMKRVKEFDYVVTNADERQQETVDSIIAIIRAEHCKVGRRPVEL